MESGDEASTLGSERCEVAAQAVFPKSSPLVVALLFSALRACDFVSQGGLILGGLGSLRHLENRPRSRYHALEGFQLRVFTGRLDVS